MAVNNPCIETRVISRLKLTICFLAVLTFALSPRTARAATPTAISLAITSAGSPVTSVPTLTAVALTATVTSSGTPITRGQVYFCNAIEPSCNYTNSLTTAQLTAAGKATFKLVPGPGSHSYVAVFAGTKTYSASKSAASASFTVTGTTPHTISTISASGTQNGGYTLNHTVYATGSTAPSGEISFTATSTETHATTTLASASLVANAPSYNLSPNTPLLPNYNASPFLYADFDGDGIPDLLTSDVSTPFPSDCSAYTANVYFGVGDGTFSGTGNNFSTICQPLNGVVADVNNDGFPDIILSYITKSNPRSYGLSVFFNDGKGNFTAAPAPVTLPGQTKQLVVADFNRDGNVDLAYTIGNTITIALGDGTGNFIPGNPILADVSADLSLIDIYIAVADMNNDGIPDIVTANNVSQLITIYEGLGDGTFPNSTTYSNSSLAINDFTPAVGDFNNDGNIDFALVHDPSNCTNCSAGLAVDILWGNGAGGFTSLTSTPYPAGTQQPGSLLAADINANGNMDIASIYGVGYLFMGDGSGKFQVASAPSNNGSAPSSLVALDLNGDGLLEIPGFLSSSISSSATIKPSLPPSTSTYTLQSSYPGDKNYEASTSTYSSTISSPITTPTLTLTGPTAPVALNKSFNITATVTGVGDTPVGNLDFYQGSTYVGGNYLSAGENQIVLPLGLTTVGTYTYTAKYEGDDNHNAVNSKPLTVNTISEGATLTASPSLTAYGTPFTFTAAVSGASGTPTGTVKFLDGSTSLSTQTLVSGSAAFTTSTLAVGAHSITAVYSGNSTYSTVTSNAVTVTIGVPAKITVVPMSPITFGSDDTVKFTLAGPSGKPSPTGSIQISGPPTLAPSGVVVDGSVSIVISSELIRLGTNTFTATYSGDSVYGSSIVTFQFNASTKRTASIVTSEFSRSFTYSSPVSLVVTVGGGSGGIYPTGTVTFSNGATTLGTTSVMANTQAALTVSAGKLPGGTSTITASYSGDSNFTSATGSGTVTLARAQPAIALSASSTTTDDSSPITFTAKLTYPEAAPTGLVTLYDGSTAIASLTPINGVATYSDSNLSKGTHSFTASYAGDANYNSVTSSPVSLTASKNPAAITPINFSKSFTYGSPISLVVGIGGGIGGVYPTGTVTFSHGSFTLGTAKVMANTQAALTFPIEYLNAGPSVITVSYSGDSNFGPATSTATITVIKAQTSITLTSNVTTAGQGFPVVFIVKLTHATGAIPPDGNVSLYDGATLFASPFDNEGLAVVQYSGLALGAHTITAVFQGDVNYNPVTSSPVTVNIKRAATVLPFGFPKSSTYGAAIPMVVGIGGGTGGVYPTGTVTFSNGSATLGTTKVMANTQAALTVPAGSLSAGTSTITISYSGDSNFASATGSGTITLAKAQPGITLASDLTSAPYGMPITFTLKMTYPGAIPTGQINIFDNGNNIGFFPYKGEARLSYPNLPMGSNSVTAVFQGDTNYNSVTSAAVNVTVGKAIPVIETFEFSNEFTYGSPVDLIVTVLGSKDGIHPTGTVTFANGPTVLGTTTVMPNTQAALTVPAGKLPAGASTITASYSGDSIFASATGSGIVILKTKPSVALKSSAFTAAYGSPLTFTASVTGAGSAPTGTVIFFDGAKSLGPQTLKADGSAVVTTASLAVGTHSITAVYSGDSSYTSLTSTAVSVTVM